MSEVRCFMLERTSLARISLRCFELRGRCPSGPGFCDVQVTIADEVVIEATYEGADLPPLKATDKRWPKACACGRAFGKQAVRQHRWRRLHRAPDGKLYTLNDAPPGAMWCADEWGPRRGEDGHCLYVKLPDGVEWCIDGPATSGGYWTRTGEAPNITARPSIKSFGYHGFLTDGVLRSC